MLMFSDASLTSRSSALLASFGLILLALSAPLCSAATLYVSQDGNDNNPGTATSPYKTIQAAVNNATSGDTITLHASTFSGNGNRDIDFAGKILTINSDNGATRTVIDCGGTDQERHRAFYLHSKEKDVIFEGLTIKDASDEGAVNIGQDCTLKISKCIFTSNSQTGVSNNGTVALTGCKFTGNTADYGSSGIDNRGTATLTGCTFTGNSSRSGSSIRNGNTMTLTNCAIAGNNGGSDNGGIGNGGTMTLTDCAITRNTGSGGIGNGGTMTLTGCAITGNNTSNDGSGGGIGNGGTMMLINCEIIGNTSNNGGGIMNNSTATLTNCTISNNTTIAGNGGGIANRYSITVRFCSIFGNTAKTAANQQTPAQGGGLENDGTAILTDDVLWGNTAPNAAEIGTPANGNQTTTVTYCDIQGGLSGVGNIKANPLFVSTANPIMPPIAVINVSDADLHLQAGSPCRGAGITIGPAKPDPNQAGNNPNYKPDPGVSTDADGLHRPNPPSIGAYEYTANPKPVKKQPLVALGAATTENATDNVTTPAGGAAVPGAAGGQTADATVTAPPVAVVPPIAATAPHPVLGPAEQKQVNDELLHLMVSLDTNTLSHDEMTRQIQGELDKGAQIDARDGEGFPAIVTAASLKRADVVQVLLELNADPNAVTIQTGSSDAGDDSSVLHKTANGYQVDLGAAIKSLFGHKSKPKPVYGQSALMFAAQFGLADTVTLLLDHHAVVSLKDTKDKAAVDYAAQAQQYDIAATLKSHGG